MKLLSKFQFATLFAKQRCTLGIRPMVKSKGVGRKFSRGRATEKRPKIALLSLYQLYLYHVWKSWERSHEPSLPPAADAHG